MANQATVALGFVLLVVFSAAAIPAVITAANSTVSETKTIAEGETSVYNGEVEITVVETDNQEANLTVVESSTGDVREVMIQEGSTENVTYSDETVSITAEQTGNNQATITAEYPSTFGYSDATNVITDNIALILVATVFTVIMGFVSVGVRL